MAAAPRSQSRARRDFFQPAPGLVRQILENRPQTPGGVRRAGALAGRKMLCVEAAIEGPFAVGGRIAIAGWPHLDCDCRWRFRTTAEAGIFDGEEVRAWRSNRFQVSSSRSPGHAPRVLPQPVQRRQYGRTPRRTTRQWTIRGSDSRDARGEGPPSSPHMRVKKPPHSPKISRKAGHGRG